MEATLDGLVSESALDCPPAPSAAPQPPAAAHKPVSPYSRILLRLQAASKLLQRLYKWLLSRLEDLLEEFDPWLKWLIFDAAFTLLVGAVARQFESLQPWFAAVGWL